MNSTAEKFNCPSQEFRAVDHRAGRGVLDAA